LEPKNYDAYNTNHARCCRPDWLQIKTSTRKCRTSSQGIAPTPLQVRRGVSLPHERMETGNSIYLQCLRQQYNSMTNNSRPETFVAKSMESCHMSSRNSCFSAYCPLPGCRTGCRTTEVGNLQPSPLRCQCVEAPASLEASASMRKGNGLASKGFLATDRDSSRGNQP
jgi:hypothetical protein